jgi:peptidoglycan/xylan/chitin deacetylase (PgdA/CDA1 family)
MNPWPVARGVSSIDGSVSRRALTRLPRKTLRKTAGAIGVHAERGIPAVRARLTRGLTAFIFHEVTSSPSEYQRRSAIYLSPEAFEDQVAWINHRFTVIDPTELKQLGGTGILPHDAALITFDDAWAGVFRNALPILASLGLPSLCFLNLGTVLGDPDISAVRSYEELHRPTTGPRLEARIDRVAAAALVSELRTRYGDDPDFTAYQGPTATPGDLERAAAGSEPVWFGSHLYHHWDLRSIAADLYRDSLEENQAALARYPNNLPAFATPHGYDGRREPHLVALPRDVGYRLMFIGTGRQNDVTDSYVLDRITLPVGRSGSRDWWFSAHRHRVLGPIAR